jgi:hypothetical protein
MRIYRNLLPFQLLSRGGTRDWAAFRRRRKPARNPFEMFEKVPRKGDGYKFVASRLVCLMPPRPLPSARPTATVRGAPGSEKIESWAGY